MNLAKAIVICVVAVLWLGTAWVSAQQDEADQLQALFHYPQVVALARAATSGDVDAIDRLLEQGVDINARGYRGITVLLATLEAENKEGFQALLERGADPNLLTSYGASVVHFAADHPDPWWLEITLRHHGDPNLVNAGSPYVPNQTPLFYAITRSDLSETKAVRTAKVRLLIEAGANVNHRDARDVDPLGEAALAIHCNYEVVWLLLEAGADFQVRDKDGYNLIDYIQPRNNEKTKAEFTEEELYWFGKVVQFLIDHGVDLEHYVPHAPKAVFPWDAEPMLQSREGAVEAADPMKFEPQGEFAEIDTEKQIAAIKALMNGDADMIQAVLANPQSYAPPVLFQLSATLFEKGDKSEAAFWLYAGQLRARSDANKSKDPSARQAIVVLNMQFAEKINQHMFTDIPKLTATVQRVVEWDKTTPRDYDPRWIALHGMGAFLEDKIPFEPESEWKKIDEQTREQYWADFQEVIKPFR
jgi:ankyrin repeat protein